MRVQKTAARLTRARRRCCRHLRTRTRGRKLTQTLCNHFMKLNTVFQGDVQRLRLSTYGDVQRILSNFFKDSFSPRKLASKSDHQRTPSHLQQAALELIV